MQKNAALYAILIQIFLDIVCMYENGFPPVM